MADYSNKPVRKQVNITVNGLDLFFYPTHTLENYVGIGRLETPVPDKDVYLLQQKSLYRWKHVQSYLASVGIMATPVAAPPFANASPMSTNTLKIVYLPETARWFPAVKSDGSYQGGVMASGPNSTEDPAHVVRRALVDTSGATWHDPAFWGPSGDVNTDIGIARVLRAHLILAAPDGGDQKVYLPTYNDTYGKDTQPYGGSVFVGLGMIEYKEIYVPTRTETPTPPTALTVDVPPSNPTNVP